LATTVPQQKLWTIYSVTLPSGKTYIGQTCKTVEQRLKGHLADAKRHSHLPFHRAILKYGFDALVVSILSEHPTKVSADIAEIHFIAEMRTQDPAIGYNLANGGQGGGAHRQPHSAETKQKLSRIKKGCLGPNKGKVFTPEAKQKMRQAHLFRATPFICDQTGERFSSLSDAAEKLSLKKCSIAKVLSGKRTSLFGLTFTKIIKE